MTNIPTENNSVNNSTNNHTNNSANNKRIAKNTLMLYFRMLFLMGVSLYTSRVVLNTLGIEDYGIYNVVGGVVAMFTMISGSLSTAISRFITFELGKRNQERLNTIFSTSIIIQLVIGIIIAILVETVGVWFLANKMVIPLERLTAAKWVLQFSLITLIISLISVPYNAAIIAHERMSAFAYISILEALGKLVIAYFVTISPIDRLIFYAILAAVVSLTIRSVYSIYCRRHFEECKFRWLFDKQLLKEMFGFTGWNFIGSISYLLRDQGGNIILNMFGGGPIINAARGISIQVNSAVNSFSSNFMMAVNPQITKSYASCNLDYMTTLILQGARLSFYLLLFLSLPILFNTNYILTLWLNVVPNHAVLFIQLTLCFSMLESISTPVITAMLATGNIKKYQIIVGALHLLNLPISYLMLRIGLFPEVIIVVAMFVAVCCLAARLYLIRSMMKFPVRKFIKNVFFNVIIVSAISSIAPFLISQCLDENFINFILISVVAVLSSSITIYFVGCNASERQFVKAKTIQFVDSKITHSRNR